MNEDHRRLLALALGTDAEERVDKDLRLIVLPALRLPHGCSPSEAFAIYVACQSSGYDTRLFLERPIRLRSGVEPKTTTQVLLGRTMYAASIQGVPSTLPPHQGILAHLKRYEQTS